MSASYPPEPWRLRGQMYVSLWSVPRAQLPPLPPAVRPLTLAGRALVGTAWVDYGPGGVLEYRELLSAVLVRRAARPLVTITDIWVDSPASRDGGRELWGIPKELADLTLPAPRAGGPRAGSDVARAASYGAVIAEARLSVGARLPGRWPARFSVAQMLGDRIAVTPVRSRAHVQRATASWHAAPDGPLAYLAGRQPLVTLALPDFRLRFGRSPAS
ncbi:acetoacetate decarboxylase family protein [Phytohabitans kaempferiae]|uniref:Acetoacetate decarboxylase family protein n=1 Tax=Phytohabitans kaempferiae TaxID=1620943 RepID=A0ABV6LYV7_9ACTN